MSRKRLKDIVKGLLIQQDRMTPHNFQRMYYLAKEGYRDMWYDAFAEIQRVRLKVDKSNNTVVLPDDFIKEVGVYYAGNNSELIALTRNEGLVNPVDDCGVERNGESVSGLGVPRATSDMINKLGQFKGGLMGAGGRSPYGDFDVRGGVVYLSTDFDKNEIFVKYLSMPKEDGDILVHPFLEMPIQDYVDWKMIDRLDSYPRGEKEARFDRYIASKDWAMNRLWSMNADETKQLSKKNFTLAPKL